MYGTGELKLLRSGVLEPLPAEEVPDGAGLPARVRSSPPRPSPGSLYPRSPSSIPAHLSASSGVEEWAVDKRLLQPEHLLLSRTE